MLLHRDCVDLSWHHHVTLSPLALWFLCVERRRLGGENPGGDRLAVRGVFTRLLRDPPPSPERIAEEITRVLRRKEVAWIYKWHKAEGLLPPRRPPPDSS
jgi:hypothetical protein